MNCTITSPEETNHYDVSSVQIPAMSGAMTILPGHVELFTLLSSGTVSLTRGDESPKLVQIEGGACHVKDDEVVIIV